MKQFFKTVLAGCLAGLALFVLPFFLVRVFVFFLLIGAIFKLMGGRRRGMHHYVFAHNYKNMSEEERANFMKNYQGRCYSNHYQPNKEESNTNQTNL